MSFSTAEDPKVGLVTKSITASRDLIPTTCPASSTVTPVMKVLSAVSSVVGTRSVDPSLEESYL